ncbi:MAG: type II secretion system protein [Rickettsiales bacterium]|nr:type II secretion system protein [Rickettsiales bacterium]
MIKKTKNKGFSLLEMSIVVAIIGTTIGFGILSFNQYSRYSKTELTKERMKVILKAINDYADKFNSLPCPANGEQAFNHASFGVGSISVGACTNHNALADNTYFGIVPVNTLNIYPSYALDGWGNRFSYAVKNTALVSGGVTNVASQINLKNYGDSTTFNNVVVIVISHGENGFGAWKGNGGSTKNPTSANAREARNSSVSADGFHTSLPIVGFDDIIYFLTSIQITDEAFE